MDKPNKEELKQPNKAKSKTNKEEELKQPNKEESKLKKAETNKETNKEATIGYIFRRDLRIYDNNGLLAASQKGKILPMFIFTDYQIGDNQFKSNKCLQFMIECLEDLQEDLQKHNSDLLILHGDDTEVMKELKAAGIALTYAVLDYTPFARSRAQTIRKIIPHNQIEDIMLTYISESYLKFTPYYNYAKTLGVQKVSKELPNLLSKAEIDAYKKKLKHVDLKKFKSEENLLHHGGRKQALLQLEKSVTNCETYAATRDLLAHPTSEMSAYNKFGCVSIREVYTRWSKLKPTHRNMLIRQLYWRDFYYQIAWYYPHVLAPIKPNVNRNLQLKYGKVKWITWDKSTQAQKDHFICWQKGITGFPIVDACMRQLNQTGMMHNRGRLIVSSFLIKNLHWHWQEGERYFASKLYDYDPCQNNGGWQWGAGSGTDSQPYFRIMSPSAQSARCDPDCEYILKWVPELEEVPYVDIHDWHLSYMNYKVKYPNPIINISESREKAMKMYYDAVGNKNK